MPEPKPLSFISYKNILRRVIDVWIDKKILAFGGQTHEVQRLHRIANSCHMGVDIYGRDCTHITIEITLHYENNISTILREDQE